MILKNICMEQGESAAIAVLYAAALSIFVYREMSLKTLSGALLDTAKLAAVALFCVGTASAFGWLLAYYQIPKALRAGVGSWGMGITATGFFIAFCSLVVGCFLVLRPFVTAIVWAAILCVTMWPLFLRVCHWFGGRVNLAALAMVALIALIVLAPFVIVGVTIAENADRLGEALRRAIESGPPDPPAWVAGLPVIGEYVIMLPSPSNTAARRCRNRSRR